tara:strand:- start:98 stop:1603 length:1506 start_codon:yes stop_codon:yes gene_type:complete
MGNVLTDILGLFKRRKIVDTVEADDLFVLAKPFTPPEGVLNPRPYMDVRLIKASDMTGVGEVNTASNLGTIPPAIGIFAQKVGTDLQFKSLLAGPNITLTEIGVPVESIEISGPAPGETNTMTNIGTGLGNIFSSKVGVQFQLRTIKAGSNITVSTVGDEVIIDGAAPGEVNDGINVGAGTGTVFFQKVGTDLEFKTLKEGTNITINNTAGTGGNEIEISASHGAIEDLETTLAAGNFTGANDIVLSTQLATRIIRSDNAVASQQMAICFFDNPAGQDLVKIGDPLISNGGSIVLGDSIIGAQIRDYTTAADYITLIIQGSDFRFQTTGAVAPGSVVIEDNLDLKFSRFPNTGTLDVPALTLDQTYDLPDESGIIPVGPAWDTLIANPTVTEDGYRIAWNDGNGEYELVAAGGSGSVRAVSTTQAILADDQTLNCTSTITLTLPTAAGINGKIYNIKNSGVGVITVDTTGAQTIDGTLTKTINVQWDSMTVQSTGSNWIII